MSISYYSGFAFRSLIEDSAVKGAKAVFYPWGDDQAFCTNMMAAGSRGVLNRVRAVRIIDDQDMTGPEAVREAAVAALERINAYSKHIYHELSDTCWWIKPANFKNKSFAQALKEARDPKPKSATFPRPGDQTEHADKRYQRTRIRHDKAFAGYLPRPES